MVLLVPTNIHQKLHPNMELDENYFPTWAITFSIPDDSLSDAFPSQKFILEAMDSIDNTWDIMPLNAYILSNSRVVDIGNLELGQGAPSRPSMEVAPLEKVKYLVFYFNFSNGLSNPNLVVEM